jgi:hypothetical protein
MWRADDGLAPGQLKRRGRTGGPMLSRRYGDKVQMPLMRAAKDAEIDTGTEGGGVRMRIMRVGP